MASKRYASVRHEKGDSRLQANASTNKFDTYMDSIRKGGSGRDGSLKHQPSSIRKLLLSVGGRIRA